MLFRSTAFHLYVPFSAVDVARRFCQDLQISVTEFWAYTPMGDQFRFSLVHKVATPGESKSVAKPAAAARRPTKPAVPSKTVPARKPATKAKASAPAPSRAGGVAKKSAKKPAVKKTASRPAAKRR